MIPIKLYRPSNGTEGWAFVAHWCCDCERDKSFWNGDYAAGCLIVTNSYAYQASDPKYPQSWIYDANGKPCCTAFVELGTPMSEIDTQTLDLFK